MTKKTTKKTKKRPMKEASKMTTPTKTDDEALQWMRDVCFALPNTSEGVHYGEIVFKVGADMFASCGAKRGPRTIVFQINPKRTAELLETDKRFRRYPYEKSGLWIKAAEVTDWEQLRTFVEESYQRFARPAASASPAPAAATPKKNGTKKTKTRA
jgi:predicted DNA-binding protein (MmcQ/YjbR family)